MKVLALERARCMLLVAISLMVADCFHFSRIANKPYCNGNRRTFFSPRESLHRRYDGESSFSLASDTSSSRTSFIEQIQTGPATGNPRSTALNCDFMGMINFCLRTSDSGLSGPSRTKLLNEVTNEVFRVLMIGYPAAIGSTLERWVRQRQLVTDELHCCLSVEGKYCVTSIAVS